MMLAMAYIILSSIFFTAVILVGTAGARHTNTNVASLLNALLSIVVPLLVVAPRLTKRSLEGQSYGLGMAALGGLLVGFYVLTLTKALSVNKVGIVVPIIYGSSIFATTILSYFLYKEKISFTEGLGLALLLAGFSIIIYARATTR